MKKLRCNRIFIIYILILTLTISNFAGFCYISDSVALAADNDVMSVTFYHDDVWEGNEIEYIQTGTVKIHIEPKNELLSGDEVIVAALYKQDLLQDIILSDVQNINNGNDTYTFYIPLEDNAVDYRIRVFVWDSLSSMRPVATPEILSGRIALSREDVLEKLNLVNNYWINNHPESGDNTWAESVYHIGNLAAFDMTKDMAYYDYSYQHAEKYDWLINSGKEVGPDFYDGADWLCIGQTYLDLYKYEPEDDKIANIKENIDLTVNSSIRNSWWWIDAMFMAAPIFVKLANIQSDRTYTDVMYELYHNCKTERDYYDQESHLWYRDYRFIFDLTKSDAHTPNNKKVFWSRGNGWVFAAHAKIMSEMSRDDVHWEEYESTFREMAEALRIRQRPDGFWNPSLDDPEHFGSPETSGTAAFLYGFAWGVNNGILSPAVYIPVIEKAWNGLVTIAIREDGYLGYVQGPATRPTEVSADNTSNYAVGLFLMAACVVAKLAQD